MTNATSGGSYSHPIAGRWAATLLMVFSLAAIEAAHGQTLKKEYVYLNGKLVAIEVTVPPGQATLISPSGTITTLTPTYTWNAVSGSSWYYLWVNDSSGSGKIKMWYTAAQAGCSTGTGTCAVTPGTTLAVGSAAWWIQTWNAAGFGPWSDARAFSVIPLPGKATLVSPTGTINTTTPTYTWNAVSNSTWYYLKVNDSSGLPIIQIWYAAAQAGCGSGTGTCSVSPSTELGVGARSWLIQTWNDGGYGPWSDEMQFTVYIAPPGKATQVSPSGPISTTTSTSVPEL